MSTPQAGLPTELGQLLAAGDPVVWTTLRSIHAAGADGRCQACRSSAGAAPPWPCTLRTIADEAARLAPAAAPTPDLRRSQTNTKDPVTTPSGNDGSVLDLGWRLAR